jgi:hypothetical protein
MKSHLRLLGILAALYIASTTVARADSWIFQPSYFTHSPDTGERVTQYAPPAPSYIRSGENYLQSGYRHHTIDIPGPGGNDHMHVVETWGLGDQIRPYGEWLRPYRPGATPYGLWGYPQGRGAGGPTPYGSMPGNPAYPQAYPGPNGANPYGANPYGASPYGAGYGPGVNMGSGGPQSPYPPPYAAPGAGSPQASAPLAQPAAPSGDQNVAPAAPGPATGGAYRSPYGPPLLSSPRFSAPPASD